VLVALKFLPAGRNCGLGAFPGRPCRTKSAESDCRCAVLLTWKQEPPCRLFYEVPRYTRRHNSGIVLPERLK